MTFAELIDNSTSAVRVLVQLDIAAQNSQWVNDGAGIWHVNFDGSYPGVGDNDLLDGLTSQTFTAVGSVTVDGIEISRVDSLAELTAPGQWYHDDDDDLYVILSNYDDPNMHSISFGVIYGYSHHEFTPLDSSIPYEGRLANGGSVGLTRDPLFYGRISFGGGNVTLANADGEFDSFAEDNNIYGNPARVLIGFDDLSIDNYQTVYEGIIDGVSIDEAEMRVSIIDRRGTLKRPIQISKTNENPIDVIADILSAHFSIPYSSVNFDTTAWAAAVTAAADRLVTLDMQDPEPAIDVIEDLCAAASAVFWVDADSKFSAKVVDRSAATSFSVYSRDILDMLELRYDSSLVVTSTRIGYAHNWEENTYTHYEDDSRETTVFERYKVYRVHELDTYLSNATGAESLSDSILDDFDTIYAEGTLRLPISYYDIEIGDIGEAELNRANRTMIGTKKIECLGVTWNLDQLPTLSVAFRATE